MAAAAAVAVAGGLAYGRPPLFGAFSSATLILFTLAVLHALAGAALAAPVVQDTRSLKCRTCQLTVAHLDEALVPLLFDMLGKPTPPAYGAIDELVEAKVGCSHVISREEISLASFT